MLINNKSHLTAITRHKLPSPSQWLIDNDLVLFPTLDYGCGKCFYVNPPDWENYDPYWYNNDITSFKEGFGTVICNYVLNVLLPQDRLQVLQNIQDCLMDDPNAVAYISVRTDRPNKNGWGFNKRGTFQDEVNLPLEIIKKTPTFKIYRLTKTSKLV